MVADILLSRFTVTKTTGQGNNSVDDFAMAGTTELFPPGPICDEETAWEQALAGRLRNRPLFDAEVDRMLTSPKAR